MRVLHSWLKELLPGLLLDADDLAKRLLLLGFEVERVERRGPAFSGVVVGEVRACQKHPNADRLKLCAVWDGSREFTVVCGAPNVAAGQRVAFARLGAALPGGVEIAPAKIRGIESQGMICSSSELGLEEGKSPGILVLEVDAPLGQDFAERLGGRDAVLEVSVTPNRPDCLSHLGLARELGVHLNLPVREPARAPAGAGAPAAPPIELKDADCSRYLCRSFEGLRVGPSPVWLRRRLEALGLRSVNNAVDVTNYVLLELGQPLHLFDLDRLSGGRVAVRAGASGESLEAINGKRYELSPENLVIADGERPAAIAGVMGGRDSEISSETTRAFLEAAHFAPGRVRRSARRLGLRTDSSLRFQRGTDPSGLEAAAERATSLLLELCGGKAGPLVAAGAAPAPRQAIPVTAAALARILGTQTEPEAVTDCLKRLGEYREDEGSLLPPPWRLDLRAPEDVAEEVARHLGYDQVPYAEPAVRFSPPAGPAEPALAERARDILAAQGFLEAYNYDFVSEDELRRYFGPLPLPEGLLRLHNPLSADWGFLRPTLMIGLLRSAALNFNRGADAVRLFEVGKSYLRGPDGTVSERLFAMGIMAGPWPARPDWRGPSRPPDLYDAKAAAEALCGPARCEYRPAEETDRFHPSANLEILVNGLSAGHLGALHPALLGRWQLERARAVSFRVDLANLGWPKPPAFSPLSPFPSVRRDISVVVDESRLWADVEACARAAAGPDLARLELIDVFTGPGVAAGSKSLTLRLSFSRMDRTLRDAEVAQAVEAVVRSLAARLQAALRA